ncbi:unnamed protein product [Oppiella nova]|uniref:Inhibitor of growth protein N-terminal histone-binding domain-containing protein n=1 Tax=Oppiella nova TaxID=334625 RepID=A0A7R9QPP0_9ACAR|nr:unnamed protein product [Oppiella nova]CAG2170846.1 unnamed protein product [Oppiella nova]
MSRAMHSKTTTMLTEMWAKMRRTKQINTQTDLLETQLRRCLSTFDIVLLGIGHMVGSGAYVLTSSVARNIAGPAIIVSFMISGLASFLSALSYAEFAGRFPKCGSAYSYSYLALGELWSFIVGWNMILENVIGTAAVSRACSAYMDSLLNGQIRNYTLASLASNIAVIVTIIVVGLYYSDLKNWKDIPNGFMPYGWRGVFAGSATCFYAYIGSMTFATISYVAVSAVLTLMVPYNEINAESGLPDAFGVHGAVWIKLIVIVGASCGMVTVLIGTMFSLTRIVYAMSDDGLLFSWMGAVNPRTQIPLHAMYFFASIGALMALFIDITTLIEMMSIGTLIAYLVVSASVIVIRYEPTVQSSCRQSLTTEVNNQELNDLSVESSNMNEENKLIDELVDNDSSTSQSDHNIVVDVMAVPYLEHFLDSLETLPTDLQRNFTLMRDLDTKTEGK